MSIVSIALEQTGIMRMLTLSRQATRYSTNEIYIVSQYSSDGAGYLEDFKP